jgi:hypothetical protein
MKKSLTHLPKQKQTELMLITEKIREIVPQAEMVFLFGGECPQEHHLDVLGDLAADYCPELKGIIPRETESQKELFELLDYAYIGARYDRSYKITKEQLEQLAPCVRKLHEVTEKICKEKIESFS